jgi:hypothetical protein
MLFVAFLRVTGLMVLGTQLSPVLHVGSRITCHSFLNLLLLQTGRSLLRSKIVVLLVDSLYTEAIKAVKSRAALSAPSPELIWILGETNSEATL